MVEASTVAGANVAPDDVRVLPESMRDALDKPLDLALAELSEDVMLESHVDCHPQWEARMLQRVRDVADYAFSSHNAQALREVHRALFLLYDLQVVDGTSARARNQFNATLTRARSYIERAWLNHEAPRTGMPVAEGSTVVEQLKALWASHPVAAHRLFDFLEKEASREQIVAFFKSDNALNVRFFDLLVYSMIGSRECVRGELANNFWDESGRGDASRSHVSLFQRLLDVVGAGRAADHHASELSWQGLAGHNLFMFASVNRQHYFKLLGIMAMTELLDPSQYEKLARGCRRVGLGGSSELEYYDEHVTIDVIHGEGWLSKVIAPVVQQSPAVASDILLGAGLRLATCNDYYDDLYGRLRSMKRL